MNTLITILIVIAAIILVLVVLVQNSKGGGLSSGFSSSNAIMGVRKTTDVLEKTTWGLALFIMVMSIVCVVMRPKDPFNQPTIQIEAPQQPTQTGTPDMSPKNVPAANQQTQGAQESPVPASTN